MRRRDLIILGGAAFGWPLAVCAQKAERVSRVGVLMGTAESDPLGQQRVSALRRGLSELGWQEGRNLQIEIRWAASDAGLVKNYTAELIKLAPVVVVVLGALPKTSIATSMMMNCQAAPHRRHRLVEQTLSEHRSTEGPADERCHHSLSQCRAPLSSNQCAKNSGHYPLVAVALANIGGKADSRARFARASL